VERAPCLFADAVSDRSQPASVTIDVARPDSTLVASFDLQDTAVSAYAVKASGAGFEQSVTFVTRNRVAQ
jgi:hypothetical protein